MKSLQRIVYAIKSWFRRTTVRGRQSLGRTDPRRSNELPVPAGSESTDQSAPRTLTFLYEDARRVIDHQIAYLNDVDDKAVRTVRINAVVLGVILSVRQLTSQFSITDPFAGLATVAILGSMVAGIVTYTTSDAQFGPGPRYIDDVLDEPATESYWRSETLRSYADWIEDNEHVTRRNGTYLLVSQLLLLLGLTTLTTRIALELLAGIHW